MPCVRKIRIPGSFITAVPSIVTGVAPNSIQNFREASTSRTIACHWPMVTPFPLGAASWACEHIGASSIAPRRKADFDKSSLPRGWFLTRDLPAGRLRRPGLAVGHRRLNMFVVGVAVLAVGQFDDYTRWIQRTRVAEFHAAISHAPLGP